MPTICLKIWYNASVIKKHWSVAKASFGANTLARAKWELEERINFGIGDEKISADTLREQWDAIDIDPWKRKALALALE